jgi:hypothetical protein
MNNHPSLCMKSLKKGAIEAELLAIIRGDKKS